MTNLDDRRKGFEAKWAHDADLRFKIEARRNRALGAWAAAAKGLSGPAADDFTLEVIAADFQEAGDEDVFRKVKGDLAAKGIAVDDTEIRTFMAGALAKAVVDLESAKR